MILDLQEINFEVEYRKGGQRADDDAIFRLLRFEDNLAEILKPQVTISMIEDEDLRTIFRQHYTLPDTLAKIQDLVRRASTDSDFHQHPRAQPIQQALTVNMTLLNHATTSIDTPDVITPEPDYPLYDT
jgi:hypothetical protein